MQSSYHFYIKSANTIIITIIITAINTVGKDENIANEVSHENNAPSHHSKLFEVFQAAVLCSNKDEEESNSISCSSDGEGEGASFADVM